MPESRTTVLARISDVHRALAEARTLPEILNVVDAAAAMREVVRHARLGLEAQNYAAEAKLRAERAAGELLRDMERAPDPTQVGGPGRGKKNTSSNGHVSPYTAALESASATRQDAARWQKIAAFPVERFESLIGECLSTSKELTTAYVLRAWRREEKNAHPPAEANVLASSQLEDMAAAGMKFGTVYADPAWLYGNQGTRGATGDHYPGMTPEEIASLPVCDIVADDAHLHLWTTNAFLFDARTVLEAWGFTYKSCFIWVKPQMGMGNYWRVSHEFCLLGVRGSAPFGSHSEKSWREWPRGKHSAKPERMYELIERVSPGPYLEMFARRRREAWSAWGNGIESDLFFQEKVS